MAKYSVPSIKFTEIDNTIRNTSEPGLGIGAIVMKSNKGPVNQRIVSNSYSEFTNTFGEPESTTDYGHFAAENYLAVSNQLYSVRATMGDETYAQIQYPYTDAESKFKYTASDIAAFKYIDNEDAGHLELCKVLTSDVADITSLTANGAWSNPTTGTQNTFALNQKAQFCTVQNLINDEAAKVAVFKPNIASGSTFDPTSIDSIKTASGTYCVFPNSVKADGEVVSQDSVLVDSVAWASGSIPSASVTIGNPITSISASGHKVNVSIPAADTMTLSSQNINMVLDDTYLSAASAASGYAYSALFSNDNQYKGIQPSSAAYAVTANASKLEFLDWDDCAEKTYYIQDNATTGTVGQAVGVSFRQFRNAENEERIVMNDDTGVYSMVCTTVPQAVTTYGEDFMKKLAQEGYGVELAEINNDKYSVLSFVDVNKGKLPDDVTAEFDIESEVRSVLVINTDSFDITSDKNEDLFWLFAKKDASTTTVASVYTASAPESVVVPWQDGMGYTEDETFVPVNKMYAFPTSEVLNRVDGKYKDGYTLTIESDDEPGIGDIEEYSSVMENQLIIGALGPGKFGNDVGVSIITTACADIAALNHQNAFCWKYKYDDEDLVNKDDSASDLTWKKVYRINVYTKTKTQDAATAWGSGLDAMLRDPVESWFVSNDPNAKDASGNSLFAPNVINGHSDLIYVSRASANAAITGTGKYAQPVQTYSIYGLTGGDNSKKNLMTEKTQALKLYQDRQKADFDILFNVDAIDTFNGKQRYAAHQNKIAEIAAARTMDIGVVQLTSTESKSIKRMLSEGKSFAFNNGSYVAGYAGYDKYYNSALAAWVYLPKSVAGACAMAYCDMFAYPWMAPAGTSRGSISYASNQLTRLSDDEIGQLYDVNINTSRLCGAYGEILWGQKTALKKDSALNRINVRRCLNYIEKQIESMMTPYLFQQNTANTRSSAKNSIDSFLSRVKAGGGLEEYATSVTQDSTDPHIMNVNLIVRPTECIEFIDVKITITRDTITTSEG